MTTTRANQVVVGNAANTYTMPGVSSAASLAAQIGPTSYVTTDGAGNLAASSIVPASTAALGALDARVGSLEGRTAALENNVAALQRDVRRGYEGSAIAIAMGGTVLPDNKRYAISANFGTFRGENAFAASAAVRLNEFIVANAAIGAGLARGGVGGRVGATFAW